MKQSVRCLGCLGNSHGGSGTWLVIDPGTTCILIDRAVVQETGEFGDAFVRCLGCCRKMDVDRGREEKKAMILELPMASIANKLRLWGMTLWGGPKLGCLAVDHQVP